MGCGASRVPDKPTAKRMVLSHDGVTTITRQGSMAPVLAAGPGEESPAREPMTSPIEQPGVELAPEPQPRLEPEPEVVPELEPEPEQEPQPQPQPQPELDILQQAGLVLASETSTPSTSSVHRPALVYAGAASVGGSFLAPLPSFGAGSADDDGARRSPGINPASLAHVRRHSDGWRPALSGLWADGADALSAAASSRSRLHRGPRRPPSAVRPVKHSRFPSQSLALS
jgi:outer membrane biosynthesis protein TonB